MTDKEALSKFFGILYQFKMNILPVIFCLLLPTGLNLFIPLISRSIMDEGLIERNQKKLLELVLISFGIYLFIALLDIIKEKKRIDISSQIQFLLSERAFTHLMKMKISYFDNTNYAELLNNINMDIIKMSSIADNGFFYIVTQIFGMFGGFMGLFIINFRMTFLVLAFLPFKYVFMKWLTGKHKQRTEIFIKDNQTYAKWFGETVGGVKEIRLFNIIDEKQKEFENRQKQLVSSQKAVNMLGQWNQTIDFLMVEILSSFLYVIGANLMFQFQLTLGSVFAFITYSAYVTGPITTIMNMGYLMSGIIPSTKRFFSFMELQEEESGNIKDDITFHELSLKNVFFRYENKDEFLLKDINLSLSKGSKTAIIGKNGAGKSTIAELLTRMYIPQKGEIYLDKLEITKIDLYTYRNLISVVSQQIYLFNDTIKNNICLYREIDEDVIMAVCRDCGLEEFVGDVSLDYIVGHNGALLSGGQKQKIALARAIIYNKDILIFDEITSNVDSISEIQIKTLFKERLKDKTILMITHKPELLREMEQFALLEDGKIQIIENLSKVMGFGC